MRVKNRNILIMTITAVIVIAIDRVTKYLIRTTPSLQHLEIIKGWLAFHYTQNPGMALGIDFVPTPVISIVSLLAVIIIVIFTVRVAARANKGQMICMGMIIGGASGNLIDRMFMAIIQSYGGFFQGHVVDFIFFNLRIDGHTVFPYIFNFADACITTSILILIVFNKYLLPSTTLSNKGEELTESDAAVSNSENNGEYLSSEAQGFNSVKKSD